MAGPKSSTCIACDTSIMQLATLRLPPAFSPYAGLQDQIAFTRRALRHLLIDASPRRCLAATWAAGRGHQGPDLFEGGPESAGSSNLLTGFPAGRVHATGASGTPRPTTILSLGAPETFRTVSSICVGGHRHPAASRIVDDHRTRYMDCTRRASGGARSPSSAPASARQCRLPRHAAPGGNRPRAFGEWLLECGVDLRQRSRSQLASPLWRDIRSGCSST